MKFTVAVRTLILVLVLFSSKCFAQDNEVADEKEYYAFRDSLNANYNAEKISLEELQKEDKAKTFDFVRKYPNSPASLKVVQRFFYPTPENTEFVEPLFNLLSSKLKESPKGKVMASIIRTIKNASVGMTAPDFEENNDHETPVKLSDYRGNYVLLDFWASWCHPCRAENPFLLKTFERFKAKKFAIISVSLDTDRDNWMKAIKQDNLPWVQLCDFAGVNNVAANLYAVESIPRIFLIDPDGKIIGKDMSDSQLTDALIKIFNLE